MANDDEILLKFGADVASYEKAIDRIEAKTLGLQTAADGVNKRVSNIGKGAAFKPLQDGLKQSTQEAAKFEKEVKKTTDTSVNGFVKMRNELKLLRGQMADLAAQGKENTAEFKALQLQAGALQDTMKDLGASIQLNAGDPLENLTGGVGALKNSFASLDFDGVSRSLGSLATNIGRVDINTFKDGLSAVAGNIVKLGAAILTSPIFLVGAAVAGIIAGIVTWGDSMEETAAKNDKAVDKILKSLEKITAEYERQIKLNEALGKSTEREEDKKLRAIIRASKQAIDIKNREIEQLEKATQKAAALGIKQNLEDVERFKELTNTKFELEQQLDDARNDLRIKDAERQKKADADTEAQAKAAADKAKVEREKRNAEILAAQRALQQSQINLLSDNITKQRAQIEFDFKQRIDAIKGNSDTEKKLRESLALERDAALRKVGAEAAKNEAEDIKSRQAFVLPKIKELSDAETQVLLDAAKTRKQIRAERAAEIAADIAQYSAFGNTLVEIGTSVSTLLAENQQEAAEKNKLFAAFGIGLNLATSLSQMIAGATAAAAQTGVLAPFTLVAYIAQGTALVLGAFAQIKTLLNAPVPKAAAHGEEFVQGKARGRDTEHYMLAHGERVVTSAVNEKYWDVLHAMHTGNERAILPALRKALGRKAESDNESFASNIANSLMLSQGWKGGNIVDKLGLINQSEEKRHSELLRALTPRSTQRKK